MKSFEIDSVLRVRLQHQPGQLARLATAIAEQGATLGEISTIAVGAHDTIRDIIIETADEAHTERVVAAARAIDGIELLSVTDRVFDRHRGGKLHSTSTVELTTLRELRYIYTPGVARVARAIEREPALAREYTGLASSVGIFTNGTRVLGLGNIGPLASLPVMEGKAVLYDKLAGISATPLLVDTTDPDEFVRVVERLAMSFGGIHLEDIRVPDCFAIEAALIQRLRKPVMHDDQHGTATVALAAVINACRLTGIELKRARIGQIGLGAAGSAIASLALAYGVGEVLVTNPAPEAVSRLVARGARAVALDVLMREAGIVIAATGKPGLLRPAMVRPGQVILALSNPEPEIDPGSALTAGAAFASDGRSINNALAFPGLFKGALEIASREINAAMMVAAAETIASLAEEGELVPSPLSLPVHQAVAAAVARTGRSLGLEGTVRLGSSEER